MSLTYTDIFCGAGGSSIGLTEAGFELKLAANHWDRAIETHSANFPDAEHLCADVNNYDMRRLPRTDVLWASPICTEVSPAGGRRRRAQPDLFDHGPIASAGFERTRATFWDVIRATEVHRYRAVIVENVTDVVDQWELFDLWVECMKRLGYNAQFVSVSSAHVGDEGNPHAPQWRDRLYVVFTKLGVPLPDVEPRPPAWCSECGDVPGVQSWKNPRKRKIGKYRQQYVYRCPNAKCRHAVVEPYVLPAAAAIDWSDLGQRIGDRSRPLAEKTLARIRAGLAQFARPITLEAAGNTFERRPGVRTWPAETAPLTTLTGTATKGLACPPFLVYGYSGGVERRVKPVDDQPVGTIVANGRGHYGLVNPPIMVAVNHDDAHGRAYPADAAPLPPRTTKIGDAVVCPPMLVPAGGTWRDDPASTDVPMGARTARETDALVCPPYVTMLRGNNRAMGVDEPLATMMTGRHHYLTVPPDAFYVRNFGHTEPRYLVRSVGDPLGVITARDHHALVVPYYRTGKAKPTGSPLDTVTARDRFALVDPAGIDVDDCLFRMLQPREHLRAQRFPDLYVVTGNKGEQTMQAGNAVSANVAHWLGRQVAKALGAAA